MVIDKYMMADENGQIHMDFCIFPSTRWLLVIAKYMLADGYCRLQDDFDIAKNMFAAYC